MAAPKMHAGEIDTDVDLVRRLLAEQFPQWADLPIDPVVSYGTDHDIYRLGDQLAARLPRIGWATHQAAKEAEWLPKLAPHLPLAIPVQVAMGRPAKGYPFEWSISTWLPGENANGTIDDLDLAAVDLAAFVSALRRIDASAAPPRPVGARGAPLAELDKSARRAIAQLGDDASWLRGRGWSLYQAVMALPYYWDTNPGMIRQASHALAEVLAES
jgi:aminoglycoside phosphotransferase (APT) family kinase protein